jgi:hypothetical protein
LIKEARSTVYIAADPQTAGDLAKVARACQPKVCQQIDPAESSCLVAVLEGYIRADGTQIAKLTILKRDLPREVNDTCMKREWNIVCCGRAELRKMNSELP